MATGVGVIQILFARLNSPTLKTLTPWRRARSVCVLVTTGSRAKAAELIQMPLSGTDSREPNEGDSRRTARGSLGAGGGTCATNSQPMHPQVGYRDARKYETRTKLCFHYICVNAARRCLYTSGEVTSQSLYGHGTTAILWV